jgi:hypothetical protein
VETKDDIVNTVRRRFDLEQRDLVIRQVDGVGWFAHYPHQLIKGQRGAGPVPTAYGESDAQAAERAWRQFERERAAGLT